MDKFYLFFRFPQGFKSIILKAASTRHVIAVTILAGILLSAALGYGQDCSNPAWSAPSLSGSSYNYIKAITFNNQHTGDLPWPQPASPDSNYINLSSPPCFTVCTGLSYTIILRPGLTPPPNNNLSNDEYFAVAIDFSGDGTFSEPGEFFPLGRSYADSSDTAQLAIPANAAAGNYRIRFICQPVSGPALTQSDVCGTPNTPNTFGEAIDFCLQVNTSPQVYNLPGPVEQCGGKDTLIAGPIANGTMYRWSDTSTGRTTVASTSGIYQVTVTAANGCTVVSNTAQVFIKPVPVVNLGPDIGQCGGGPVTIDAGNNGTATYLWSVNDSTGQTLTVNSNGQYSVTVTNINSSCTAADTVNVNFNSLPPVNFSQPSPYSQCGGTVLFKANDNPSYIYTWSTGLTGPDSNTITVSGTGVYSVTITAPSGCSVSGQSEISIYSKPDIGPDTTINLCGASATFNLVTYFQNYETPITSYGIVSDPTAAGAGTWQVTGTNANGCNTTVSVTININPLPNPGPNLFDTICPGTTIDLDNIYNLSLFSDTTWFPATLNPVAAGAGIDTLTVTNTYGCAATVTANIVYTQLPALTFTLPQSVCETEAAFALNQGSPAGGSYSYWNGSAFIPITSFNPGLIYYDIPPQDRLFENPVQVEYTLAVSTSDSTCYESTGATVDIYAISYPYLSNIAFPSSLCTTTGPIALNNYFITSGLIYSGQGVVDNFYYPALVPPGNNTILVTDTANGCSGTYTIPVNIEKTLVDVSLLSSIADFTLCEGQSVTFIASGAEDYQFFVNGMAQGAPSPDSTFSSSSLTNPTQVMVKGSNQCSVDNSNVINIQVITPPVVNAGRDTTIARGESIVLNGTATGATSLIYEWTPGTGLNLTNVPNPTFSGPDSVNFWFKATDTYGCSDSSAVSVDVVVLKIVLPNVITPNGDGINDVWNLSPELSVEDLEGSHLVIFNRSGQTVYETESYANKWGGTYKTLNGNKLPDDTYYYVLQVPSVKQTFEGAINILSSVK